MCYNFLVRNVVIEFSFIPFKQYSNDITAGDRDMGFNFLMSSESTASRKIILDSTRCATKAFNVSLVYLIHLFVQDIVKSVMTVDSYVRAIQGEYMYPAFYKTITTNRQWRHCR